MEIINGNRIFQLQPFLAKQPIPEITITSSCIRQNQQLQISYLLKGDLSQILLPAVKNNSGERKNELWQTTCFEFFLAIFNDPKYWEFNLSPTGDWNVYSFTNYRRGMREAATFPALSLETVGDSDRYQLSTKINLRSIISGQNLLDLAITTVIEDVNHHLSYWAIIHPGNQPDFHRRDSFIKL
jgi:hypothetical protein